MNEPLAIVNAGLVTSVGLSCAASCAAIRAGLTNPTSTRFVGLDGELIAAHQVELGNASRGLPRFVTMLAMVIDECIETHTDLLPIPLLVCVAEQERPGRLEGLDDLLIAELESQMGASFDANLTRVFPHGRVGLVIALNEARRIMRDAAVSTVLIAAVDSLISRDALTAFDKGSRILTTTNSNGFLPGEAASALLVSRTVGLTDALVCEGIGVAMERAHVNSENPLKADGLVKAVRDALAEAHREMHEIDFRITDNSGEQYYFKEGALALTRTLRARKDSFDIWHPADCIGEVGAAIGPASLAVALMAARKSYSPGDHMLFHAGNDSGMRGACVLRYQRQA